MINCKVVGTLMTFVDAVSFNQNEKDLNGDNGFFSPSSHVSKQATICPTLQVLGKADGISMEAWTPQHRSTTAVFLLDRCICPLAAVQVTPGQSDGLTPTG